MVRLLPVLLSAAVFAQQPAATTLKGMQVQKGLAMQLWASEPMLVNPTNIDIDERGRVWVLEAVNYRRQLKNEPDIQKEGDRILILEDTDNDGKADKRVVFDQSADLRAPIGIAVLGDKVYVSQSPNLFVYTKDAADKIVKKEVLLTGWGGVDHDHGVHAITFGFDGRLYFNAGDQGFQLTDKSGNRFVSSKEGPFYAGTALRMNMDGSQFTVLGHNFRNPFELAQDSFGGIWQTDNDDDGNAWTRLNYVLEGGNYGYWGPGGRSWRADKGSHFHSELPGVMPNIARTGPGSPCGLIVYEGDLLPESYRGQLIHAEAGKRYINTFRIRPNQAGYETDTEITVSAGDSWFRPSDVTAAPDGSVFVSDWYDPGVGGHNMKDHARGRIYRLAPVGHASRKVAVDLESAAGLRAALRSPTQSIRYIAWQKLAAMGEGAREILQPMWTGIDRVAKARSLWLLARLGGTELRDAAADSDPRMRILAIRAARAAGKDWVSLAAGFAGDRDVTVRREAAALLREAPDSAAVPALARIAEQWDGKDRWYLEAVGIGATGREDALYAKLGEWSPKTAELVWRLRPAAAFDDVRRRAETGDSAALRILSHYGSAEAAAATARLVSAAGPLAPAAFERLSHQLFSQWIAQRKAPEISAAIKAALQKPALQSAALELAGELSDPAFSGEILAIVKDPAAPVGLRARAIGALGSIGDAAFLPEIRARMSRGPAAERSAAVRAFGQLRPAGYEAELEKLFLSNAPNEVRSEALRVFSRTANGVPRILTIAQQDRLPAELKNLATNLVHQNRDPRIRARAQQVLPAITFRNRQAIESPLRLIRTPGDAARGKRVFSAKGGPECSACHALDPKKKLAGPNLSNIGNKFGKEGMLDAILNPSASIAPEYATWVLETKSQGQVIGVIGIDTAQQILVYSDTGEPLRLRPADVKERRSTKLSMMPEDLVNKMSEQQIIDLLEYLATLKEDSAHSSH
ncbi:MAG: c-type cytochrome [Acidobacteria bacterium]|nr:c-type cytochrome [Acidobacteriota bacterium]